MLKGLVRVWGFFSKELYEVRRQPRLVLALILGPFLILLLFGLGYQSTPPRPRAALVIPDAVAAEVDPNAIKVAASLAYEVVLVTNDENAAAAELNARRVDLVEVIPSDVQARIERGEPAPVEFRYAEINPINETWLQSVGYAQVNEMNKALLVQSALRLQKEARDNQAWVSATRQELDSLSGELSPAEQAKQQDALRRLRTLVTAMAASPLLAAQLAANGQDAGRTQAELSALANDLDALDKSITDRTLGQQQSRLEAVRTGAARFETLLKTFGEMPPQVLVSPLQPTYENTQGQALSLATFYAPGVLALILQHIAVTLGALSLVRERLLGAIELFRVAPTSPRQILLGKYLAYALVIGILGGVLAVAMSWMQVPFRGETSMFVAIVALLVVASLGLGFLISTISKSDTQAVQLSMLLLLLSIFFSGFFLPLDNFILPVRMLGYLMPITPTIQALQDVMLRGVPPPFLLWVVLSGLAVVTFLLANVLAARQLRFAAG